MTIGAAEIAAIDKASRAIQSRDIETYFELKRRFLQGDTEHFRMTFNRFYGIGRFQSQEWVDSYYANLFKFRAPTTSEAPHRNLLVELWKYPRKNNRQVLEFSFVSKLIAFHDEGWPLFDANVRTFFGIGHPPSGSNDFRIEGFIRNLNLIRARYREWLSDRDMKVIFAETAKRLPALNDCDPIRMCDFHVWTAGRNAKNAD